MAIKPFIAKLGLQAGNVNITNTSVNVGANVVLTTFNFTVGNSVVSTIVSNNNVYTGNSTTNSTVNSVGFYVGSGVQNAIGFHIGTSVVNSTTIVSGNFTANTLLTNAAALNVVGQTNTATLYITTSANVGTATHANASGVYTTGTVNAASHTVGTSTIANSLGVYTGIVNAATHSVGTSTIANSLGVYTGIVNATTVNAATHSVGALFTANSTLVNTAAINVTGRVNTATFYATTSANVGANVQVTTSGFLAGNDTSLAAPIVYVQNSTSRANVTSLGFAVGTTVANSTVLAAGANVYANTTSVVVGNSTVNSVISNNTIQTGNATYYTVANMSHIALLVGGNSFVVNAAIQLYMSNGTTNTQLAVPSSAAWSSTNYFLHANGSWVQAPYTPPGGSDTHVQYNSTGSLAGNAAFTYNSTGNLVTIANTLYMGTGSTNTVVNTSVVRVQAAAATYAYLSGSLGSLTLANTTSGNTITISAPSTAQKSGGYYLESTGNWSALSVTAGGSNTYIQFNDSSAFGGNASFTFKKDTVVWHLGNSTINAVCNSTSLKFSNTIANVEYGLAGYTVDYGTY